MNAPSFEGNPEQQELASAVFQLMSMQGTFYALDAPIRQTLTNLAEFLARKRNQDRDMMVRAIDDALSINQQIFKREQQDDEIVYVTSRQGGFAPRQDERLHTFAERLYQPENPLPVDDISVVVSTSRPALTTVEPVFISDYWQEQAGLTPLTSEEFGEIEAEPGERPSLLPAAEADVSAEEPAAPAPAEMHEIEAEAADALQETTPQPVEPVVLDTAPEQRETPDREGSEIVPDAMPEMPISEDVAASAEEYGEQIAEEAEKELAEAHVTADTQEGLEEVGAEDSAVPEAAAITEEAEEPAAPVPQHMLLHLDDHTAVNLGEPVPKLLDAHRDLLRDKLIEAIDRDPLRRIVHFGDLFYPENELVSLGKNDLRRIREDILEAGEPLLDTTIINDLYYHSQRQSGYECFRFSLNYRLSREKDFEFVGVEGAWLWSVKGLPVIGTRRIKASEMGQLTSYLTEGHDDSLTDQDSETIQQEGVVTHMLTFFEWVNGILVLDSSLRMLLPDPLLPDQRSAVLRIESPQHYTSYPVEVRYPTSNRGGWLQGLEEFFREHLVAGAVITLERTEDPNIFTLTYEETPGDTDRILTFDEKKNKFAFADMEYYCTVDDEMFLKQQKFGRLKNLKSLPTGDRRKADQVLQHVFEVVGDRGGTRSEPAYQADLDTLYIAYTVLRPASRPFIQSLLENNENYQEDAEIEGIYSYTPEPKPEADEEDELDDIAETILQWDYDDNE